ncbi:MAG: metal-sulfur cluster assembly factor [Opitutaceae bacterium]|nr:metal-sulfur cluster assembly factor [Opitutaceae bacterium]
MNSEAVTDSTSAWAALRAIPDPEFGVNIVDLGLIYSVEVTDGSIDVVMTLTTETCPSGAWIHEGVKNALARLPGVKSVNVDLVFEPAWNPNMLSAEARRHLGTE